MSLILCNPGNTLCLYKTTASDKTLITIDAKVPDKNGYDKIILIP